MLCYIMLLLYIICLLPIAFKCGICENDLKVHAVITMTILIGILSSYFCSLSFFLNNKVVKLPTVMPSISYKLSMLIYSFTLILTITNSLLSSKSSLEM